MTMIFFISFVLLCQSEILKLSNYNSFSPDKLFKLYIFLIVLKIKIKFFRMKILFLILAASSASAQLLGAFRVNIYQRDYIYSVDAIK